MKKPIISIKNGSDVCRLVLCLLLTLSVLMLFYLPEQSVAAFSDGGGNGIQSLFGLVKRMI